MPPLPRRLFVAPAVSAGLAAAAVVVAVILHLRAKALLGPPGPRRYTASTEPMPDGFEATNIASDAALVAIGLVAVLVVVLIVTGVRLILARRSLARDPSA